MSTGSKIKTVLEKLAGGRVWIDRPTDIADVHSFISTLHPRGTAAPLIRVGSEGDGGYLIPDDLCGISACVSPGVSVEISFDLDMAERGMDVYMADASVDGPPVSSSRFHFTKKFLDVFDDEHNARLDTFCQQIPVGSDLLLQMDIEGAEQRVLLDASPETLQRFRIIVIEFHDVHQAFTSFGLDLIRSVFRKISVTHSVVHLHPNNYFPVCEFGGIEIPRLLEVTFYRNDREFDDNKKVTFPHELDVQIDDGKPPIVLGGIWGQ